MRHSIRLLVVPASLAVLVVTVIGGSSITRPSSHVADDSAAVASVVDDFHAALSRGDSAKALSLLAPDAVILESGGVESRSEYRSHHLPEDIKFAKLVASKRQILQVSVEGSSAWTVGTSTTKGTFTGRVIDSIGAESMVFQKPASGWRIRSIHWS